MWQDWVLSIGNFVLAIALIPSIRSSNKPALTTSLITGSVLMTFAVAFITLNLLLSAVAVSLGGICWFILAYQKSRQK